MLFGCACIVLALSALGCGASSRATEAALAPAASAGDEPPPSAAVPAPAEEQKPARGRIVVQATCAGKPVIAHGHMPIERGLVVDFEMGQEFSAEAGTRNVTVELGEADVLVDKPTLQLEIPVEANKLTKLNANFPWARVQLNLLIHGNAQPPTNVKLIRKGEVVAEVKTGGPAFLVSPGNYEADVPVRGKTARVKGLVFFEGTEQIVPVRVP